MNTKTGYIREYIISLLEYLDGRGIVFADDDLVREALDGCGNFDKLRSICNEPNKT